MVMEHSCSIDWVSKQARSNVALTTPLFMALSVPAGLQLNPWCSQQLLQLLPVLMLPLHNLLLQQPAAGRLLLSVGLPAVQLPQQLQQHLWGKLASLTRQLPAWLPVAEPVQHLGQQQQQLMRPSCCLFARYALQQGNSKHQLHLQINNTTH
jgi:hypothetical protein